MLWGRCDTHRGVTILDQGLRASNVLFLGSLVAGLCVVSILLWRSSKGPLKRQMAYRHAEAQIEAIVNEARRAILLGLPAQANPNLAKGWDYLMVALSASVVMLVTGSLMSAFHIPDPLLLKPTIEAGDCLDRYAGFDGTLNWRLAGKVDCRSKSARVEVLKSVKTEKAEKSCWRHSGMAVSRDEVKLCLRPILKPGLCVPAWEWGSEWYGYFGWTRECGAEPPDAPTNDRPGKAYSWGKIRITTVSDSDDMTCPLGSGLFLLADFDLTVCAMDI